MTKSYFVISNDACANYLYNAYVSLLLDFETSNACLCIVYLFFCSDPREK